MGTLPTLTVLLDNGTGTFPFDITSKVMAIDGYEISRGRDDWQGAVTAGELGLTLNNSDGRFSPGSTILATPSPITVDQKIRLSESSGAGGGFGSGGFGSGGFGGGGSNRFTGYVKSWPVSWPATVTTFSEVQITATDAQARAERRTLLSFIQEEVALRSPTAYYTLSEPDGSVMAGDSSGNQATSLTSAGTGAAVVFGNGTGPGTDGLSAVQIMGGKYLTAVTPTPPTSSTRAFGFWFNTTMTPGALGAFVAYHYGFLFQLDTTGHLGANVNNGAAVTTSNAVNDGTTHFAVIVSDGVTFTLYVDGIAVGVAAVGAVTPINEFSLGGFGGLLLSLVGTLSHAGAWSTLTAANVAALYSAGLGAPNESGTARMTRLAGYAGITVGTLDTSLTNMPASAVSGKTAFQAIQDAADAEFGLVFIDGNGALTFHNRNRVASKLVPDLTLDRQWVTPDVQPVVDDQRIINYSEVTAEGTGATQLVRNATSESAHGRYPDSRSYVVQTDAEAIDRANWIVSHFAEPTPRYGTLTINLYGMPTAIAATVVDALDLNCWLRVTSLASQNPGGTTADVVVQGWREEVTAESWTITCNVVARSLYNAWILEDSVYGLLDSTTIAYV